MPFPTRTPPYEVVLKDQEDPGASFETLTLVGDAPNVIFVVPQGKIVKMLSVDVIPSIAQARVLGPVLFITNQTQTVLIGQYPQNGTVAVNKGWQATWSLGAEAAINAANGTTYMSTGFPDFPLRSGFNVFVAISNAVPAIQITTTFYYYQYSAKR